MRKSYTRGWLFAMLFSLFAVLSFQARSQEINPDEFCVQLGEPFEGSLLDNDFVDPTTANVIIPEPPPCISIVEGGQLIWDQPLSEECCGQTFEFIYFVEIQGQFVGEAMVSIEIKCDKPDCSLIDLATLDSGAGDGQSDRCIEVCEWSSATLLYPFDPDFTYDWTLPVPFAIGANDAQIIVDWESAGSSWVQLDITDDNGELTSLFFCVDVLEGPQAEFITTGYACLDAPMTFENLYPYAASYTWDFGDGTIINDDGQFIQHTYDTPGNYTVVLSATTAVYGDGATALCCCTQEFQMDVEVDELPGPEISCISTLCEGDAATYTTNAENCDEYIWTVLDADGNIVPIVSGDGTNTIEVVWGAGPFGTVTLEVSGCDDDYCDTPTTVYIPIISSVGVIGGDDIVCAGSTSTYTLPKWLATNYAWNVSGGTIISDPNMHTITIEWGAGPTGSIDVQYQSDFLIDLDGHDATDCQGTANLDVNILPEFSLENFQPQVCVNSTTSINATAVPSTAYSWTIDPAVPFIALGGSIQVDWNVPPGTYIITAESTDGAYCNTIETTAVQVSDIDEPLSISGPEEICGGETAIYIGEASQPGVTLIWNITGGTPTFGTGPSISVLWDASGPYEVSLTQQLQGPPFCTSDPISITPELKSIAVPSISGTGNCTNSIESYSIAAIPYADAIIEWEVLDPTDGSVVAGQGTNAVDVQWNNSPGTAQLQVTVTLCGISYSDTITLILNAPIVPVITVSGNLCPGVTATLSTTAPFSSYDWSTGDATAATDIDMGGLYSVTTTDVNNCEATSYFTAEEVPSPDASLSTPNLETICINNPHTVNLVAITAPDYEFTWYCNGSLVQGPSAVSNYTHVFQNTPGSYSYYYEVENTSTGCVSVSNTLVIFEEICNGGIGCTPEPYDVNPSAVLQSPECNKVQFDTAPVNFTPTQWFFDDGNSSTNPAPLHTYLEADCYLATVKGEVPSVDGGVCVVTDTVSICVPLAANFTCEIIDCRTVDFTNLSTFLGAPYGTPISSVEWDFDGVISTSYNDTYTFPSSGTFPVTLTVFNGSGCEASYTKNVTINSVGVPVITISDPNPCVGDPISLSGSASNAISYTWDLGDGTIHVGQSLFHTYEADGSYMITLTVEDVNGCTDQVVIDVDVEPGIPPQEITGALVVCEGEETLLSAPAGYDYEWSNGALTQDISVGPGTYSVTITDANDCTQVIGPVEVVELPTQPVVIEGEHYICDAGCVDLFVPFMSGALYEWFDQDGNLVSSSNFHQVCHTDILPNEFTVAVTDVNGCRVVSEPFFVELAISPSVSILASGALCEGDPNELTADPFDPSLSYLWSTGESGESITVLAAGDYTVTVIDPVSGCSSSDTETINPLPDLCSVPVGCYEDCDSVEVCVLPGLGTYQWNLAGSPILGANSNCYWITMSGVYSLTITTPEGCSDTSGDLEMIIEPCDDDPCDHVEFSYDYSIIENVVDSCCVDISYTIDEPTLYSIRYTSLDADLAFDPSSLSSDFSTQTNTPSEVRIANIDPTQELPQGTYNDFMTLCVTEPSVSPQTVLVEWLDQEGMVQCTDSILFDCPVEPDCLYLLSDSAYCEDGSTFYSFTVCNPMDQDYSIGFIEMIASSPAGVIITPSGIDLSADPIDPGECQTILVELLGSDLGGETFCYTMIAHGEDPADNPATPCCSLEEIYCIDLPFCDPCEEVYVESVLPVNGSEGCCYEITLVNDFAADFFDEIVVSILSPSTTFTIDNPVGSGWFTSGYTGTDVSFIPDGSPFTEVPLGTFDLPVLCIDTDIAPEQDLLIQWMKDGEVLCEDSISVFCEPDCGYLFDVSIDCDPDTEQWIISSNLQNTSDFTISEAVISFDAGSGLTIYNETVLLGSTPPNTSSGIFSFDIGSPAQPGDTICFNVTIHEVSPDGLYLSCCTFEHCIVLPDCGFVGGCDCDEEFFDAVQSGINVVDLGGGNFEFSLNGAAEFSDECDYARWAFGNGTATGAVSPFDVLAVSYDPGSYEICVKVYRTADDGTLCSDKICVSIVVSEFLGAGIIVFPNPNDGQFVLKLNAQPSEDEELIITLLDYMQRPVLMEQQVVNATTTRIPVTATGLSQGIYILHVQHGEEVVTKQVYITR
ncbi:PKD domain-containing protein [Sanyastnella coralliicola]|uniref:PKD domain-containing protein n=1 Tax=Sanyastnella coralliicola TaxID=3069118 RepID=UPI0027B9848C|nr:PKD domain-containing protein [Longitalea sp. SCSIO 12813]